jgi:hypothetical protein
MFFLAENYRLAEEARQIVDQVNFSRPGNEYYSLGPELVPTVGALILELFFEDRPSRRDVNF